MSLIAHYVQRLAAAATPWLACAAVALLVLWLILLCRRIRPSAKLSRGFTALTPFGRLVALVAVCLFTLWGGSKEGTSRRDGGYGTSGARALPGEAVVPRRLPPDVSSAVPVTNADWLAFGAYEDWFHIPPGDWCFRFGTNLAERLTVFSCGEIRATPRDTSNRISVLGLPLAIVPAANWRLLPDGRESLFWHVVTPSNTLTLTWENALVGRDTNLPVTVRAELFPDGAAAMRCDFADLAGADSLSNAAARIWRDGVEETVPLRTGTVAEASFAAPPVMGASRLEDVYARLAGGDANAYYFADAVVSKGPAVVRVACDGESTLGGYAILAEPGETNRLPFLIGPRCTVSSETAFSHFSLVSPEMQTEASHPSATNLTDRLVEVQWPVAFGLEEVSVSATEKTYALRVEPGFLGGTVRWDGGTEGGPPLRAAPRLRAGGGCACGCQSCSTNTVSHALDCPCSDCTASGGYGYEGHEERFEVHFPGDAGGGEPPDPPDEPPEPPEPPQPESSVSILIEKPMIFFEDAYENGPDESVPRRSTFCKIECVYTAVEAGTLSFSMQSGANRIILHEGSSVGAVTTGGTWSLQQGDSGTKVFYAEGITASEDTGDVCFKADFTPDEGGAQPCEGSKSITVVRMTVTANANYPSGYKHRHVFGVCEQMTCKAEPSSATINWDVSEGGRWIDIMNNERICLMPDLALPVTITVSGCNETFDINVSCLVPSGIDARLFAPRSVSGEKGRAGDIGMLLDFTLMPTNVSFAGFRVSERPSEFGTHTGYFDDPSLSNKWYHTTENGAGTWYTVRQNSNYYAVDDAYIGYCEPSWSAGTMSWEIPNAWLPPTGYTPVLSERNFLTVHQVFTITADGTVTVTKHGNYATRTTNDNITVNGVIVK